MVQIFSEESNQSVDGSQVETSIHLVAETVLFTTTEDSQSVLELQDTTQAQRVDEMLSVGAYAVTSLDDVARCRGMICTPIKCVSVVRIQNKDD
ncbi:hypothetical protein ACEWPM_019640 [Roseovarius sp. S4756]|uniref:hypothetical protein n=1 Tax=Roseovarius maritimus TaxID=3342637 RepID=UPI0037280A6C